MRGVDGMFSEPGGKDEQRQGHHSTGAHSEKSRETDDAPGAGRIALPEFSDVFGGGEAETKTCEDTEHTNGGLDHPQFAIYCLAQHTSNQDSGAEHESA